MDRNAPFEDIVFEYLNELDEAKSLLFLESLAEKFKQDNADIRNYLEDDPLMTVLSLLRPGDVTGPKWFRLYTPGPAYDKSVKSGLFEFFDDYHPFSSEVWGEPSERTKEQMGASGHFVAVITQDDVDARDSDQGAFVHAFEDWQTSADEHGFRRKRFVVLLFGRKAESWWDKRRMRDNFGTANSPFDDRSLFVLKLPDVSEDLSKEKNAITRFLSNPVVRGPFGVVVLGEPTAASDDAAGAAADGLGLVPYLSRRNPHFVQYWQDGWASTKKLNPKDREELFKSLPIFVRPTASRDATITGIKAAMMVPLVSALGYTPEEIGTAWETVGKFRRVYWRPEGNWPDVTEAKDEIDYPFVGPLNSIGTKLLSLADFIDIQGNTISTRFEDMPADDPKRTLLSSSLQQLREDTDQQEDDTEPVSLEILSESICKFDRAKLNIVAAHDQRAAPHDKRSTIGHFEDWDATIDQQLATFFPGREPKVLRIAVLFQNFDEFDGLRFAEGLTVNRWNLLKLRGGPGEWTFDGENVKHLKDTVVEMLQA
ncbi:hypothetical protein FJV76_26035 [Mesorhizobium sp. WSM4303]|uniref:hypothetical protein n=1 Tax=unclassified Mesorhizobium TaxID=325217 RepID=UPI00115F1899|nr:MULTISPECIES: hypothetical protein [unclassified Mesorhizobium]TRC96096.1 hypothetical protein FJV77_14470 [Mesorhizobium sp. WSM4306]TRC98194.1 hypothetical protein FJV76_26035 [Mesorhizobium sp. WSM4303]